MKHIYNIPVLAAMILATVSLYGQIGFTEVTTAANFDYTGESWGNAWGDANGDGWPDLFCSNHFRGIRPESKEPSVYINQQDGTFQEVSLGVFGNDFHGAAWADVDRDGDQECVVATGRNQYHYMIYNTTGESFVTFDSVIGPGDIGRARQIIWQDVDLDGKLDIIVPMDKPFVEPQKFTSIYWRSGRRFINVSNAAGFTFTESTNLGTLMDVDGDRNIELVMSVNRNRLEVYDNETLPFIPYEIFAQGGIGDIVSGDYNGDLLTDMLVLVNKTIPATGVPSDSTLGTVLYPDGEEQGFTFKADLPLTFEFTHARNETYNVLYGATADPQDTTYDSYKYEHTITSYPHGIRPHTPGVDNGIYIGYDSVTQVWSFLYSNPAGNFGFAGHITSHAVGAPPVQLLTEIGYDPTEILEEGRYMINNGGTFGDSTSIFGANLITGALSGVSGDFDNDMDLDIYCATVLGFPNKANVLYENQGDGTFVEVSSTSAGARGSTFGLTDAVTTVDYDNDGFLDIFLNNGGRGLSCGPDQLYKNNGNSNHYLELHLEGTLSNIDAVGAIAIVDAGGKKQVREQNAGAHRFSQNHFRLHYGLGSNTIADTVTIYWPSGITQVLTNVAADQILTVYEPSMAAIDEGDISDPAMRFSPELQVGPNPVADYLTVNWTGEAFDGAVIELTDISGRVVKRENFSSNLSIDMKNYPAGLYQLSLYSDQGELLENKSIVRSK